MNNTEKNAGSALAPLTGYAPRRELTSEDVVREADKSYDLGRKHGRAEMIDDIIRARDIALRLTPTEAHAEIQEAFTRLTGSPDE